MPYKAGSRKLKLTAVARCMVEVPVTIPANTEMEYINKIISTLSPIQPSIAILEKTFGISGAHSK